MGKPMTARVSGLDHVQLAMPPGREDEADAFYCGVLGFRSVPKPEPLASRGGRWYTSGAAQLHLGVEADFRAARKAHPALLVTDLSELSERLDRLDFTWRWDDEMAGVRRIYVDDPFGNRVELIDSVGRDD